MSNDHLPVVRANQQIAKKDVPEAEVVATKEINTFPSPSTSATGQIVKAVVSAALDWFDRRLTSHSVTVANRSDGTGNTQPRYRETLSRRMQGRMRDRNTSEEEGDRFGSHRRRRKQRCKSGNRGFNRHKRRIR